MSTSESIAAVAAIFAAFSVVVSLWAAHRASKFSDNQLRLSNRADLHMLLLELDRELLHDPSLYSMFRSRPSGVSKPASPEHIVKLDTYVVMYLNLFELAHAQFRNLQLLTPHEREVAEAWNTFAVDFFADCERAIPVWHQWRQNYYASFREHVDEVVRNVESRTTKPSSDIASTSEGDT